MVLGQRDGMRPEDFVDLDEVGDHGRLADAERGGAIVRSGDVGGRTVDDDELFDRHLGRAHLDVLGGYVGEVAPDPAAVAGRVLVDVPDADTAADRGASIGPCGRQRGGGVAGAGLGGEYLVGGRGGGLVDGRLDGGDPLQHGDRQVGVAGRDGAERQERPAQRGGESQLLIDLPGDGPQQLAQGGGRWYRTQPGVVPRIGAQQGQFDEAGSGGRLGPCHPAGSQSRPVQPEGRFAQLGLSMRRVPCSVAFGEHLESPRFVQCSKWTVAPA